MRANPGGEISPDEVVGRDDFIDQLWDTLEHQSVLLVSERRFGKTTVTKKMKAHDREGWLTVWRDVEDAGTAAEFAERVCRSIEEHLSGMGRSALKLRAFVQEIAGTEIAGVIRLPPVAQRQWKTVLEKAFEDLAEAQDARVLFVWDELPFMLQKVIRRDGEQAAMDVLDTLRHLRQTHGRRFPMMYCGSIGMHHVARRLRFDGHTNPALNDLLTVELPPLPAGDARELCRQLILGENLSCGDMAAVTKRIAGLVDGVPFYIHSVVQKLRVPGGPVTAESAERIVAEALVDANDPWHLRHYQERLHGYYGHTTATVAAAILDELAAADKPQSTREIQQALAATATPIEDLEALRDLLLRLGQDHYLTRSAEHGRYAFRFPLIRRWWRLARDLV